jgi:pseudolysin/vibriolysin
MNKGWKAIGAVLLAACSGHVVTPTTGGVGQSELRSAPAFAATRMTRIDPAEASLAFTRSARTQLGLNADADFAYLRSSVGGDGLNHVRLQQLQSGIKVWGSDIVVHSTDSDVVGVDGRLLTKLENLDLAPSLGDGSAMTIAKSDVGKGAIAALHSSRESTELVVLPLDNGQARLAWHVNFFTPGQPGVAIGNWQYFVDAHDGSIVKKWNGLTTATAEASGTGGNTRVSHTWNMNLDVTQSGANYTMNTTQFETKNQKTSQDYSGTSLTNFNSTDIGANDAHGFAEITLKMLKDWQGYNSIDNAGFKLVSVIHVPDPQTGQYNLDNAFWDGQQMNYGDGDGTQFFEFTGALDVIAHEIDHGFTQNHANLDYTDQSGGMNEAFSDIAGTSAKFYYDPMHADFNLGGDIFVKSNVYIRYMCTPSMDASLYPNGEHSIDNASQFTAGMDPHFSSGPMNKAFCRASKRLSGVDPDTGSATADGVKKASKAWYEANASHWTTTAQYTDGCQGVVDSAKALGYAAGDISALGDSWKDVGVTCNYTHVDDFTLSLTPTTETAMAGTTATFQVATKLTAGNAAQSLALTVTGLTGGVTGAFSPATIMSGANSTLTLTIPYDAPAGDVKLTVSAAGLATHTATATLTITAPPPDLSPVPPDMAGGSGDHGGGSGCSVAGAGSSPSATFFLLVLAAALLVRRRARV